MALSYPPEIVDEQRTSALAAIGALEYADHVCLIYDGPEDQLAVAVPFIKHGLERGECCLYVVDDRTPEELEAALEAAGVDVARERTRGALLEVNASEFRGPGEFLVEPWLASVSERVSQAMAEGFSGLRVAVEMTWTLTAGVDPEAMCKLESLCNAMVYHGRRMVGLCQYNRNRLGLADLAGALRSHPIAIVGGRVYRNIHYQPPEILFGELSQLNRVTWMLEELERQRREQEQREQIVRAEAAVRARQEFLATAAHELRTPITSLRGFAQLAQRQLSSDAAPDLAQLKDMLAQVTTQADRLARLVRQLFDISRVEAGQLQLDRRPADLVELARSAVREAELARTTHRFEIGAPSELMLPLDDLRLTQVLTNLLDNAVKFSPAGSCVEIEVVTLDEDSAQISVRDHGIGVSPERRSSLFELFYQASESNRTSGMGLGLYLSREIVEQHGGTLTAEFPADGGSRFIVTLPRRKVE